MTEEEIVKFGNATEKQILKLNLHPKRVQSAKRFSRKKESKDLIITFRLWVNGRLDSHHGFPSRNAKGRGE